jgi:hypothetical protein
MLKQGDKYGYRTETYSGSGVRKAKDVIMFEITELGNTDILKTVLHGFTPEKTPYIHNSTLIHDLTVLQKEVDATGCTSMSEEALSTVIDSLLDDIQTCTGHRVNYVLWLTDEKSCREIYTDFPEQSIDKYPTSAVILSDLGSDGILFGYENMPHCIATI